MTFIDRLYEYDAVLLLLPKVISRPDVISEKESGKALIHHQI